jgi:hypothetical protein
MTVHDGPEYAPGAPKAPRGAREALDAVARSWHLSTRLPTANPEGPTFSMRSAAREPSQRHSDRFRHITHCGVYGSSVDALTVRHVHGPLLADVNVHEPLIVLIGHAGPPATLRLVCSNRRPDLRQNGLGTFQPPLERFTIGDREQFSGRPRGGARYRPCCASGGRRSWVVNLGVWDRRPPTRHRSSCSHQGSVDWIPRICSCT